MQTVNKTLRGSETSYSKEEQCNTESSEKVGKHPCKLISAAIEDLIRSFVKSSPVRNLTKDVIESIIDKAIDSGIVIPIESRYKYEVPHVDPIQALKNKAIVGVDGGVFPIKLHPVRLILARSAVFTYSRRIDFDYNLRGIWKSSIAIQQSLGDSEEQIRRKIREMLLDLEVQTVKEFLNEYGAHIDAFFWDGPLYTSRYLSKLHSAVKALTNRSIICVKLVKNSLASRISQVIKGRGFSDADIYVAYLGVNERSSIFVYNDGYASKLADDMKPAFFYLKSPQRVILRYEFPSWVLEEFGINYVLDLVYADLALGNGLSYVIGKADGIARFSDEEKKQLTLHVIKAIRENGIEDAFFFNERRWARFLSE
ncbi:MAG: DNA double-strand break repair nuclease NurA [Candidatus Korarchaeota archaeon]|nr:DNA double-strand break repair nuclease NurA [Thermoproteota archaeon]